ncbi:MAG: hypothetical protein HZB26_24520 [Candidatus Hydrogenedentes bacterium]|nr:hypothetical protein [Candidatus Hydrogenedentota bacterium]
MPSPRLLCAACVLLLLARGSHAVMVQITVKNLVFDADGNDATQVDTVNIHTGDEVDWVWGNGSHTVTSGESSSAPEAGALFDASIDAAHPAFVRTFNDVGTFPYFCRFHELHNMKGVIVVTAPPDQDDTDGDGLTAFQEVNTYHTDPHNPDSDGDGFWDGFEVARASDPNAPASVPTPTAVTGDVDYSGATNAVDVQLVINGALSIPGPVPTDLDGSHTTDAVDVQLVINAALVKNARR